MNETVYRKVFKTKQFSFTTKNLYRTRKSKNFQRNCLFSSSFKSFELFESHDCTSTFSIFALYQPVINIAHNACGHYGKIQPGVLANHSERYIFTSSSHIIILQYNMLLNQFTPTVQYILFLFSLYGEESHEVE